MRTRFHDRGESSGIRNPGALLRSWLARRNRESLFRFRAAAESIGILASTVLALPLLLNACQTTAGDTIAQLRNRQIEIKDTKIEDAREKAIENYRRFLDETPDAELKPEAIRRMADLKVETEYGALSADAGTGKPATQAAEPGKAVPAAAPAEAAGDLERSAAKEAIGLYQNVLKEYPTYQHNDQVLYQMSRAQEEQGKVEEAMQVMDRLVRDYPRSQYFDEVQFRRAEYFFARRRYRDAEQAYASVVGKGASSSYFELALYKLGWALYKQELYDKALDRFMSVLDYTASTQYDFAQIADATERKRIDDALRAISLSFSSLGGPASVVAYFTEHGDRSYEDTIYTNLAEYYVEKGRYTDAVATYGTFVSRNTFHKKSPQFQMRVIEIHRLGGFPSLVIDGKKQFAEQYGIKAEYWKHFEPRDRPEVLSWLKTNLNDLATHYHALYQNPGHAAAKKANLEEAVRWYREYLASFPTDPDSPAVNERLADLLLENRSFDLAAQEYEKTSYAYPRHEKSSQAGYAAIYAWRQQLDVVPAGSKGEVMKDVVISSVKFAGAYPEHPKAPVVLAAAADDLYNMQYYKPASTVARKLIDQFPDTDRDLLRQAWMVAGHSSYELKLYSEAETAYTKLLEMLPAGDKRRGPLTDNLAASIYKQGEEANAARNYRSAAQHFQRVGRVAPNSAIRVNAEYDAAAALIQVKDWKRAAVVLTGFRKMYPGNPLQADVSRNIAYVYREDGQFALAADEYERIGKDAGDEEMRREALFAAAEMREKAGNQDSMLAAYQRYVRQFPRPLEPNLEMRGKTADILKKKSDRSAYLAELKQIVALDAAAVAERTPRTRSLAANAALVLAEQTFGEFVAIRLAEPFEANLNKKRELMKTATRQFNQLTDYEIGDMTAAATYYLAEMYADFSKALKESERPAGMSASEREEYDLALEEQSYPFEEKAIATHQSNVELISRGVYDEWIEKSLQKLAAFVPARYDKSEEESPVVAQPEGYVFAVQHRRVTQKVPAGAEKAGEAKRAAKQDAVN